MCNNLSHKAGYIKSINRLDVLTTETKTDVVNTLMGLETCFSSLQFKGKWRLSNFSTSFNHFTKKSVKIIISFHVVYFA